MKDLFTRDHLVWLLTFAGSVMVFTLSFTSLIPVAYAEKAKDIAAVLGFISAYLGGSPLRLSDAGKAHYAEQLLAWNNDDEQGKRPEAQ